MASAKLLKFDGSDLGTVELNDAIFGVELNEPLVHEVAVAYHNASRQGTASTKERADVRGGGRKPFRQKGTGNARQGSTREPQMRGGGTVFGPRPRSYRQRVGKQVKNAALCCVLSERVRDEALCVVEEVTCDAPRTKPFAEAFKALSPEGRKTLLVTAELEANVLLSTRNLPNVKVRTVADVNAADALGARRIVLVRDALPKLEERLISRRKREAVS